MKILVFLGSVRESSPPNPPRLGDRVAKVCVSVLGKNCEVELIDPLKYQQSDIFKPHFSYAKGKAPSDIDTLATKIKEADGYVMVSPEYNHSMSPALSNLLNHFGSSLFSYKPSAIVTYSAGQWGGVRAAVNMRTYLSELGCLPVSAMIHVPNAAEAIDNKGEFIKDADRWQQYFERTFAQLIWWGQSAKDMRERINPLDAIKVFNKDPSQRNAP
jgi:NAD(P)H-dependent FMN reductase